MVADCRFKDLCLDVVDPGVAGPFWAAALGRRWERRADGLTSLVGTTPEQTIWLNPVPERKSVKHRVHLDINSMTVPELVELGATVLDADSFDWIVLADPEGGEFCRLADSSAKPQNGDRLSELSIDSPDDASIAAWWAERFGAVTGRNEQEAYSWIEPSAGLPWPMVFSLVPEPKTVKNRMHWDVWGTTPELLETGATLIRARNDEIGWDVLADPEGNEFCVFSPV